MSPNSLQGLHVAPHSQEMLLWYCNIVNNSSPLTSKGKAKTMRSDEIWK